MRKIVFIALIFAPTVLLAQDTATINKWVKATINLNTILSYDSIENANRELESKGLIPFRRASDIVDSLQLWYGAQFGTAIFLRYDNKFYLVTARHVLEDTTSNYRNMICRKIILVEDINSKNDFKDQYIDSNRNMFLSIDSEERLLRAYDFNYETAPYIFSKNEEDIAIVNMSSKNCTNCLSFVHTLEKRGYRPISLSDIDTTNKFHNDDKVFVLGFPVESYREKPDFRINHFGNVSFLKSVVALSKGRISKNDISKPYIVANVWVYHGFSGGPLVRNSKLIGIVHGEAPGMRYNYMGNEKKYFEAAPAFMRASLIPGLLRQLNAKPTSRF